MCECMKRADGTWHVDECCADIMNDYHSGKLFDSFKAQIRREVVEEIVSYLLPRLCVLCERGYGVESEVFTSGWRHVGPRGAFKGYCSAAHVRNFAEQEASDGQ